MKLRFKEYINLTKPGIIRGNLITAAAGFLFASKGHIDPWLLAACLVGIALIIASGCVFNNYIDRGIDKKMVRTKKRAIVTGEITPRAALTYATILGIGGFAVLIVWTNVLAVIVGLIGFVDYVVIYGYYKRRSVHGTLIGGISGATPPVAGYLTVTGHVNIGAVVLFLILSFWQMPHFYAIAIYRLNDYKKAGLPIMSVKNGIAKTKQLMIGYLVAYILAVFALYLTGYSGKTYALVTLGMAGFWLWVGLKEYNSGDDIRWAKKMFGISLLALLVFSLMISVNVWLP